MIAEKYYLPVLMTTVIIVTLTQSASSTSISPRKPKAGRGGSNDKECDNHLQALDKCATLATYSYTSPLNQHPLNANEMKASCSRMTDAFKCLRTKSKCLPGLTRRSILTFISARSRHTKRLCSNLNANNTLAFIKSSNCLKDKGKIPELVTRERNFISLLQTLTNQTMKWDDKFHSTCCNSIAYKDEMIKTIESACPNDVAPQEELLNSMIGDLVDTGCPEASRLNEICPKLPKVKLPEKWKPASLTGAALELVDRLVEEDNGNL